MIRSDYQLGFDVLSTEERSRLMRSVKGKNTAPELQIRSALHRAGYRFRLHRNDLPGKPDIVLPKYMTIVFINGCFWHQHTGCRKATIPKNNRSFWRKKLTRNVERDLQNHVQLRRLGWKVITLWECKIRKSVDVAILPIIKHLS
jgi:DNA mismatch endonuclease (patch repair protein)